MLRIQAHDLDGSRVCHLDPRQLRGPQQNRHGARPADDRDQEEELVPDGHRRCRSRRKFGINMPI